MGTTDGNIEIISFHSISKGLIGECGHRGGYFECHNIDPPVLDQFYKLSSICLCANVPGQIMMSLMVDPPRPDEPSYTHHFQEMADIWESLRGRAEKMQIALSKMTNVTCNPASGAMYLFPRITFPERLLKHAQSVGKQPDQVYAMDLLNSTGIVLDNFKLLSYSALIVCSTWEWVWTKTGNLSHSYDLPSSQESL